MRGLTGLSRLCQGNPHRVQETRQGVESSSSFFQSYCFVSLSLGRRFWKDCGGRVYHELNHFIKREKTFQNRQHFTHNLSLCKKAFTKERNKMLK